jgi:hypothetical protein
VARSPILSPRLRLHQGRWHHVGPLFRRIRRGDHITGHRLGAQTICKLVKDHAAKLGVDPKQYGAHSMRAGFLTSPRRRGPISSR